ncbi:endonuclease MutS2 [Floricoccus penangensis]|uniref:endonuclease MutS2 n=1 Tax=Floricoccus penangensis TaxID=1859475 RepID=UPI00203BD7DE|nr:endonuclease MutS2 [Floricoccus penangensis]URZ87937.1 endonuclease MutS2 [Floricoccus penangensis]
MNEKILNTLEFDKVKEQFVSFLRTAQGINELRELLPTDKKEKIEELFLELKDFGKVVQENGSLNLGETSDLRETLRRLELQANLNGPELAKIKRFIRVIGEVEDYFENTQNVEFENLQNLIDKFVDTPKLQGLLQVVDDTGHIQDNASNRLFELRTSIKKLESDVRTVMQESMVNNASYLSENIITIRNDRQVLAVKVESRSKVPGIVHDMSASGQTIYIEPRQAVSVNNNLAQKKVEERHEVERILALVSDELRPYVDDIRQNAWLLGHLDLINAKYAYQQERKAIIPDLSDDKNIILYGVRHPLIDDKVSVANDLKFDSKINTIVITGPNTGGKTISLKTLGLSQLMAQSGLPILAEDFSSVGIFREIYADIGDEQSIEQSLSTFSSHMTNIVDILNNVDSESLVLLDELGAGTDPKEGAALAISILDFLRLSNTKTMATTHYPELKAYGVENPGVTNASMEFDIENLRPTYRLIMGVPGRSNALEISKRLGLFDKIIERAEELTSDNDHDVNLMIASLEQKNHELTDSVANIKKLERENVTLHNDLEKMYKAFNREREGELNKARIEAQDIVKVATEEADTILKNLHEQSLLKPHEVIDAKAQLDKLAPQTVDLSKNKVLKKAKKARGLKPGAEVIVSEYGQKGTLVKLEKDGRWQVQMGLISTKLTEDEFEVVKDEEKTPTKKVNIVKKAGNKTLKSQLDLRGMRYEEAQLELEEYIDQALLNNMGQITIVHGIGTGVIREMVQNYLKRNKQVKSFEYAPQNAGGSGATIATLK